MRYEITQFGGRGVRVNSLGLSPRNDGANPSPASILEVTLCNFRKFLTVLNPSGCSGAVRIHNKVKGKLTTTAFDPAALYATEMPDSTRDEARPLCGLRLMASGERVQVTNEFQTPQVVSGISAFNIAVTFEHTHGTAKVVFRFRLRHKRQQI